MKRDVKIGVYHVDSYNNTVISRERGGENGRERESVERINHP